MANSGTNTNKSQLYIYFIVNFSTLFFTWFFFSFITYRSCKHLDGKHTIFGRVVGGMETLNAMERIGTDNKDRPVEEILIEAAQVFTDPYAEVDEQVSWRNLLWLQDNFNFIFIKLVDCGTRCSPWRKGEATEGSQGVRTRAKIESLQNVWRWKIHQSQSVLCKVKMHRL